MFQCELRVQMELERLYWLLGFSRPGDVPGFVEVAGPVIRVDCLLGEFFGHMVGVLTCVNWRSLQQVRVLLFMRCECVLALLRGSHNKINQCSITTILSCSPANVA